MRTFLDNNHLQLSDEHFQQFAGMLDPNGDGEINYKEFATADMVGLLGSPGFGVCRTWVLGVRDWPSRNGVFGFD